MIRDLLVHVDGGQTGRRRVQFAADLAEQTGARLSGIHVTPPAEVPPLYKPSLVKKVAADLSSKLTADARTAATVSREEAAQRLPDARWFEATGDVVKGISDKARYADLVILGQYKRQGSPEAHTLPIVHSVVLRCGRPVLVVPAILPQNALARIVVAWDGSREAVRAVHDCLATITTVTVNSNRDDALTVGARQRGRWAKPIGALGQTRNRSRNRRAPNQEHQGT